MSDCRTAGLSNYRTVELSDCRTIELSDYRTVDTHHLSLVWIFTQKVYPPEVGFKEYGHIITVDNRLLNKEVVVIHIHLFLKHETDFESLLNSCTDATQDQRTYGMNTTEC